jgi:uncharacterized protein
MGRLLELVVCGVFLWLVLESWVARLTGRGSRRRPAPPRQAPPASGPSGPRPLADVTLVRCAGCGTHVPKSRTIAVGGALYCSERCRPGGQGSAERSAGRAG